MPRPPKAPRTRTEYEHLNLYVPVDLANQLRQRVLDQQEAYLDAREQGAVGRLRREDKPTMSNYVIHGLRRVLAERYPFEPKRSGT